MKLHIEENQAAVPERVDGAQGKRSDQSSEEGAPQCLERKVVTDLERKNKADSVTLTLVTTPIAAQSQNHHCMK